MTRTWAPELSRRALLRAAAVPFGASIAVPAIAAAQGLARVALVIGNAAYAMAPLLNPGRDAAAMATRLKALGFHVIERRDATRAQMAEGIEEAAVSLRGRQGVGLFYYAGHGLQIDWHNYMLPVDARIASAADVPRAALDVQQVLEAFRAAGTRTNVVVLDACRDNPFPRVATAKGLAPLDAPAGTFLAYATAPGNVAEDGSPQDGNGLYTRHLLQALQQADVPIEEVFKRVRTQVRRASGGRQIPWESTSLEEDFSFASGQRVDAMSLRERQSQFDAQRTDWELIRESPRADDYYAFLQRHPSGVYAELAQAALDRLSQPALGMQVPAVLASVPVLAAGVDRYRVGDRWDDEVVDHLAGSRSRVLQRRVTSVRGNEVHVDDGALILDQLGSQIRSWTGLKTPGVLLVPRELRVGLRWRSDFMNQPDSGRIASRNFYDHRVQSLDELELPFGRIRAYRILARGRGVTPTASSTIQNEYWVDPSTMWVVKSVLQRTETGFSKPYTYETTTQVRRERLPR